MFKWFVFLLLGYLVWRALFRPRGAGPRPATGERMVSCSQCNLNIPESEALVSDGRYFCTRQHLESWTRPR